MPNLLLISVTEWDTRVAFLEDGRLAEFYVEGWSNGPVGNVYKGRVTRLLPGMAAAFSGRGGWSGPPTSLPKMSPPRKMNFFRSGSKARSTKTRLRGGSLPPPSAICSIRARRCTTHISLAGHYLVYMPTLTQLGVSRRINDEPERQRIKATLEELRPAAAGLIARTACRGQSLEKLTRERDLLMGIWQRLRRKRDRAPLPQPPAPGTGGRPAGGPGPLLSLRWTGSWWTIPAAFERIADYLEALNPLDKYRVELHAGP